MYPREGKEACPAPAGPTGTPPFLTPTQSAPPAASHPCSGVSSSVTLPHFASSTVPVQDGSEPGTLPLHTRHLSFPATSEHRAVLIAPPPALGLAWMSQEVPRKGSLWAISTLPCSRCSQGATSTLRLALHWEEKLLHLCTAGGRGGATRTTLSYKTTCAKFQVQDKRRCSLGVGGEQEEERTLLATHGQVRTREGVQVR